MNHKPLAAAIPPGARIIIAALVPAKGDEDHPLVAAVTKAVEATGAAVVGTLIQRRGVSRARRPGGTKKLRAPLNAATHIGKGKATELAEMVTLLRAEAIVFCNLLTGTQRRNLEQMTGVVVLIYRPTTDTSLAVLHTYGSEPSHMN
ncbi:hypothetical protein CCAX7_56460 [Capsulimonas corticalis]|uniref:GTPase HflX N-terminal domain-containing protein n=1 Tax=Capsulimonas corticalis TaxID=2219043 RepID=A0A402D0L0_9BACT|nr:hypothetical protein [Capsulimonas corticalis]BDI33595.1 hypothetical protein CCAX7_56460 [Capsulimonas corticalis]